jgi:hypothetical protein
MSTDDKTHEGYRIIKDNDEHWYVIRLGDEDKFREWVRATNNWEETEMDFNDNLLTGHPLNLIFREWRIG